jgi:phosphotransferase system  glucose/maltose/N-acetylglucosamine-specific IIC component
MSVFAIGVAYGMSKDKDGAAALTGLSVSLLTTLCSPAAVAMIQKSGGFRRRSARSLTSLSVSCGYHLAEL